MCSSDLLLAGNGRYDEVNSLQSESQRVHVIVVDSMDLDPLGDDLPPRLVNRVSI